MDESHWKQEETDILNPAGPLRNVAMEMGGVRVEFSVKAYVWHAQCPRFNA